VANSTAAPYILKFISGKYQGGEFPLDLDREILIGRGSDLDMVLVEDMVSRRHARITSYGGELIIEDMGSTNGTFVNGEKVQRSELSVGDRILVGTSIIKLIDGGGKSVEPRLGDDDATDVTSQAIAPPIRSATAPAMTGAISGKLEEVPLPDLLQLFSSSRKTGTLILLSDREARIYLNEGRVSYVTLEGDDDMPSEKAFYRLLNWKSGTFSLEPGESDREFSGEPLDMSIEALMMEGMRQLDEINHLGPKVPEMTADLELPDPLVPPLQSLTPELLDTLQLALNNRKVERILDNSLAPDLETMQELVYLIENNYLREK
jgi:pSer/pThr/pTyr-binding forkhead associated (FHA) protein